MLNLILEKDFYMFFDIRLKKKWLWVFLLIDNSVSIHYNNSYQRESLKKEKCRKIRLKEIKKI